MAARVEGKYTVRILGNGKNLIRIEFDFENPQDHAIALAEMLKQSDQGFLDLKFANLDRDPDGKLH